MIPRKLAHGDEIRIIAPSSSLTRVRSDIHDSALTFLQEQGFNVTFSKNCRETNIFQSSSVRSRVDDIHEAFADKNVKAVMACIGGFNANELLPYLDYDLIRKSGKMLVGYSDLTCVLNAVFCKSGVNGILYQLKNLVWDTTGEQIKRFYSSFLSGDTALFDYETKPCIKPENTLSVVGGNARCLLKLAGTEYWPDMRGKLLLLESMGGNAPRIITYFNQLQQMGVFDQTAGVLLGTFTELEKTRDTDAAALLRSVIGCSLPIYKTKEIGHDKMSKAIIIGYR